MPKRFVAVVAVAVLALAGAGAARAEDAREDFWPELDTHVGLNHRSRLMFMVSEDRSREGDLRQATVGAHLDFFAAPFVRDWLHKHPDVGKRRMLTLRAGYRYYWDIGEGSSGYHENRVLVEGTGRFPMRRLFFLNRSRFELRDVDGTDSWRYRNRTRVEGDISLGTRTATPYATVEFFYDSRYDKWNRQCYTIGVDWPVLTTAVLETYYCRQNDSRSSVEHVNAFGLTFKVYF